VPEFGDAGPATPVAPTAGAQAAAVPEAAVPPTGGGPGGPAPAVTDEDRHRYGVLLDRAMERGLLGQADYEIRLGELSEATTIEQMTSIVTELPVFAVTPVASSKKRRSPTPTPTAAMLIGGSTGAPLPPRVPAPQRKRANPWVILAVVVVFFVVFFVAITVLAEHIAHQHDVNSGLAAVRPVVTGLCL
jgi:hypothetical protein